MMRFAHLADVHLGYMQYNKIERYNDFVQAWLWTCAAIVEEQVNFVILAGDLFHHRQVGPETLSAAVEGLRMFKNCGIPVYAVEGNHEQPRKDEDAGWMEYLEDEEYLYLLDFREDRGKVHINCTPNVVVHGMPWCGAATAKELQGLKDYHAAKSEGFHILALHGGVDTGYSGSFSNSDIPNFIDYVALGHIHEPSIKHGRIFTPGSLEACSVEEAQWQDRGALIVEVLGTRSFEISRLIPPGRPFRKVDITYPNRVIKAEDGEVLHVYLHSDVDFVVDGNPLEVITHKTYEIERKQVEGDISAIEEKVLSVLTDSTRKILKMALEEYSVKEIIQAL